MILSVGVGPTAGISLGEFSGIYLLGGSVEQGVGFRKYFFNFWLP